MKDRFFSKIDCLAFAVATALSFVVYALTLGPSVGLEDSGELATAAANLGVPHPPGYPFWTFCGWIFCKIFGWVTYMGHPTPAWCVSLMSAVFGALAAGCTAMLICRSARDFLSGPNGDSPASAVSALSFAGGIAGALTFALSPVEWSQSTIVEIYSLNAFFLMLVFLLSYRWMVRPSDKILWATAFAFGLGLTNYQVLLFAIVPLAAVILLKNIPMFRDFMLYILPVLMTLQVLQIGELQREEAGMDKDVIAKHVPVGISEKEYSDTLAVDMDFRLFNDVAKSPALYRYNLRQHEKRLKEFIAQKRDKEAREAKGSIAVLKSVLDAYDAMTPSVKEDVLACRRHELVAKTTKSPNQTLLVLSIAALLGTFFVGCFLKARGEAKKAARVILYSGPASLVLAALSLVVTHEASWAGLTFGDAPLIEPSIYVLLAIFVAGTGLLGAYAAWSREEFGFSNAVKRNLLIAALVLALVAIVTVFVFVPEARGISTFGGEERYSGPAYPWTRSTLVFLGLLGVFIALAATVRKRFDGLLYALPVGTFHVILFALLSRGAMNGLVHPASWWFWWPLVWNFFVLFLAWALLPFGRSVAGAAFFTQLGLAFYAYMPIVSDWLNPPMNWAYPRTWDGFKHAITRGQYEAITFQTPTWEQLVNYFKDVRVQFTDMLIPFAFVPFVFGGLIVRKSNRRAFWSWMLPVFLCFSVMSVLLIGLANVKGDLQDGFIQKVKFIASHAMLALWIGYGLVFAAFAALKLYARFRKIESVKLPVSSAVAAVMILVAFVYPIVDNYCGAYVLGVNEVAFKLGGSEQNGHTFGWQFGAHQLDGARAIARDINEDEEPLPDPTYPPSMDRFSVFFGGTDPGRFVPTYMIYSADYRPDIYLITQNALADDTYLSVERDLYGDEIWIPSKYDSADAFRLYVAENGVEGENGRIQVTGSQEVMVLNAILTRMIHHHEAAKRSFYVEESYPIPWMYPYLAPHGLIMKLNAEPVGYDAKLTAKDRDFWDWYTRRLLNDPMYRRDFAAQKSFSKLRTALAGLYWWQGHPEESAQAYRESLLLYPASLEPTQKYLWNFFLYRGKFAEAEELLDYAVFLDENTRLDAPSRRAIEYLSNNDRFMADLRKLETYSCDDPLLRIELLLEVGRSGEAARLAEELLEKTDDKSALKLLRQAFRETNRFHLAEKATVKYLELESRDVIAWADLAEFRAHQFKLKSAADAYAYALLLDSATVKAYLRRNDKLRAFAKTFF